LTEPRIYFSAPNVDESDVKLVAETIRNGWIAPVGPELKLFEQQLIQQFGYPNLVLLNSGTSALHMAVKLAGIKPGDKVLVGSFTFISAANAVRYEGGVPVFMDSESATWNLDPDLLEQYLIKHSGTGNMPEAVIVTHIFGRPALICDIVAICDKFGIKLIEDAAEAVGSEYQGQTLGTFGDYGVISFNGNKLITTGGGGAIICKNSGDAEKVRFWSDQSKAQSAQYLHLELGYNYRLSNVLAGLGLSQLAKFDAFLKRKEAVHNYYLTELRSLDWLEPTSALSGSNHWTNPFLIKQEYLESINPDFIVQKLEEANIEARRFWRPLHLQPIYANTEFVGGGICENLFERGFCLPSGTALDSTQQERVVKALTDLR